MNYGGDAADQIVRYSLEGIDYSLRLSGTVAKNLAIFFAAVLKDQKRTYGKTRMVRMLKENRPLKFFTVPSDRLKEFAREGKKRGLLYVVIRDRKNPDQCEIMVFADDAAKVNRVMDKMNLDFLRSESGEAVQEVAMEAAQSQDVPETPTETVEMPEGEIQFELGDMEQDFGFGEPEKDPENFMQAQEERNPSAAKILLPGGKSLSRWRGQNVQRDRRSRPSVRSWIRSGRKNRNLPNRKNKTGAGAETVRLTEKREKNQRQREGDVDGFIKVFIVRG